MMREEILEAAGLAETPEKKLCLLRECIQAAALRSLHELGAFEKLCMTGETARHFASGVPEHVVDLEFRLVDKKGLQARTVALCGESVGCILWGWTPGLPSREKHPSTRDG